MIIFLIIIGFSLLIGNLADRLNNKYLLFISIMLMVIFSGLRGVNVGIDTIGYYNDFYAIEHGGYVFSKDIFFLTTSKILMNIFHSPYAIIFIYSFFINILINLRLWDYRKYCSFSLMQLMYVCIFYFQSINIMRQFIAIAIVFFATKFLDKRNYKLFILFNILASAFHLTAVLGIIILLVYLINDAKRSRESEIKVIILTCPIILILAYVGLNYFSRYSNYFDKTTIDIGFMILYQLLCLFFINLFCRNKNSKIYSTNVLGELFEIDRCVMHLFIISLILLSIGSFFRYVERIGLYFQMFEMPFWGQAINCIYNRKSVRILACVFIFYYMITMLIFDGQGIFPYNFFWQ